MVSAMRGKLVTVAVLTVAVAACTSDGTPATTPTSTPATTAAVATTLPPETTTTTTTVATTTTLDRLAEIEAIFQDLEERRLQALYDGDREAFRSLFANPEYMERSMGVLDTIEFVGPPEEIEVAVSGVLADEASCIASQVFTDATAALGPGGASERTVVIERVGDAWGFSYIGEGWTCDGPHPFSP